MKAKANILGRVGKKDVSTSKSGNEMVQLQIATDKQYKDARGEKQKLTTWHTVFVFGNLVDIAKKYVHVGDVVDIEGEIDHKKNNDKMYYSVHCREIKLLPNSKPKAEKKTSYGNTKVEGQGYNDFPDDDIPF